MWDIERSRDVLGDPLVLEGDCIVSCSASSDSSRLLLNMASRAVHLWTIPKKHSKEEARLLVRFRGAKERQSRCCPSSSPDLKSGPGCEHLTRSQLTLVRQ